MILKEAVDKSFRDSDKFSEKLDMSKYIFHEISKLLVAITPIYMVNDFSGGNKVRF